MADRKFDLYQHEKHEPQDPASGETVVAEGLSFEDYLKEFDGYHAEWLMGKVIVLSNNTRHQAILGILFSFFSLFLSYKPIARLFMAGVPMKIGQNKPAREPDLMIILNEHRERIKDTYIEGPVDIAVEIISLESVSRDRDKKFNEYAAAGVPEYWLLDPLRQDATVYVPGDDGRYHPLEHDDQGRLVSKLLPGFALHPDILWQAELPELVRLVQAMVGEA